MMKKKEIIILAVGILFIIVGCESNNFKDGNFQQCDIEIECFDKEVHQSTMENNIENQEICVVEGERNTLIQFWTRDWIEVTETPVEGMNAYREVGVGNEIVYIYQYPYGFEINLEILEDWLNIRGNFDERTVVEYRDLLELGYFRITRLVLDYEGNQIVCSQVESEHLFESAHSIQLELYSHDDSSLDEVLILYPSLKPKDGDSLSVIENINTIFREVAMNKYYSLIPIDEDQLIFQQRYTITLNTDNIISIRFRGQFFVGSVDQPVYEREFLHYYYAVTVDPQTGNILSLSDVVSFEHIEIMISEGQVLESNIDMLRYRIQRMPPDENSHHFYMTYQGEVCIIDDNYILIDRVPEIANSYFQANPPICIPLVD